MTKIEDQARKMATSAAVSMTTATSGVTMSTPNTQRQQQGSSRTMAQRTPIPGEDNSERNETVSDGPPPNSTRLQETQENTTSQAAPSTMVQSQEQEAEIDSQTFSSYVSLVIKIRLMVLEFIVCKYEFREMSKPHVPIQ